MNTLPVHSDPLPQAVAWSSPRQAADRVMAECRQTRGFQTDQEFWMEFGRIYAATLPTVRPDQRFAFAMQVDGRLADMGLAPWSIMSRLAPPGPQASQPASP